MLYTVSVCNVNIKKPPMGPAVCPMMVLKIKKNRGLKMRSFPAV
jgi:hypothetical protein